MLSIAVASIFKLPHALASRVIQHAMRSSFPAISPI
jgi:hypothetical protein